MKKSGGITLIALVVTIIVLLILAGITISLVIGQNGIITRAIEAKLRHENGTVFDYLSQVAIAEQIEQLGGSYDVITYLQNNGYINENAVLNVEKTVGKKLNYGNGTTNDIYVVKSDGLYYVDEDGNERLIGNIEMGEHIEPTPDEYFDFDEATGTITLKDIQLYYGKEKDFPIDTIVIPSQINGITVTTIGANGMAARNLRKVIMPNTIKEIGFCAFLNCKKLEEIIIPDSVTIIEERAFLGCTGLTEINIPSSVEVIENQTFGNCSNLVKVTIPETIKQLGIDAFYNTPWERNLPDGAIYIGTILFKYNGSIPSNVVVKEGTKVINSYVFSGQRNLTKITLPNSLEKIEDGVFINCTGITNIIIPKSVKIMNGDVFRGWQSSQTITIKMAENEIPSTWNENWKYGCSATIKYEP